jgi:hypothetical protein
MHDVKLPLACDACGSSRACDNVRWQERGERRIPSDALERRHVMRERLDWCRSIPESVNHDTRDH